MTEPDGTARPRANARALERLGPERTVAFLRAARQASGASPLAIVSINDELDRGGSIAELLRAGDGYWLEVRRQGKLRFDIAFSCIPGPMVGDGGRWRVEFNADGRVIACEGNEVWMS